MLSTNVAGATEGVRHLVAAGHTRIAYLGDRRDDQHRPRRFAGYRAALGGRAGLDPALVAQDLWTAELADGRPRALRPPDPPTALFTAQNP